VKTPRLPTGLHFTPSDRRWSLWVLLVVLVTALLAMLVWLAGRYEISQVQAALERDTTDAVSDIRGALTHNVQGLQSLHAGSPTPAAGRSMPRPCCMSIGSGCAWSGATSIWP